MMTGSWPFRLKSKDSENLPPAIAAARPAVPPINVIQPTLRSTIV